LLRGGAWLCWQADVVNQNAVHPNVMRRGFCPGVWAPLASGDGLLVRVRAPRGRLEANQIRGLARAARTFGNGIIELTRRANLQLRGVSSSSLPGLQTELLRLQLACPSADVERRPALWVCPLDGLDPRCPPLEPVAEALESLLARPELTRDLSDKFSVLVSGGSALSAELAGDVRVQLLAARPGWAELSIPDGDSSQPLGACRSSEVGKAVAALLVLLGATVGEHKRMRQLLVAGAGARLSVALAPLLEPTPGEATWPVELLGFQSGRRHWFGFELPFGSLEAPGWEEVADLAERFGSGEVRLLPGRALLLPDVHEIHRPALAERAAAAHFIVERPTPWLRLVACSGAPACRAAHAETRQLASELGSLVRARLLEDATLHVSGCEKGCAWGGAADITLVHGSDGSRLGWGATVAQTARTAALGLDAIRERLGKGPFA